VSSPERRELEGQVVAPVTIQLRPIDVGPLPADAVRDALLDAFHEPVDAVDVVEDGAAAPEVLHLVEADVEFGVCELAPDGRHALDPRGHVAANVTLPHVGAQGG